MLGKHPFKSADLKEITDVLPNKNRGFYQIFTLELGMSPDYKLYEECLVPQERLVLLIVDISLYRTKEIPEDRLETVREFIEFFQDKDKDIILRFVYDRDGRAEEKEPEEFLIVKLHMEQLAGVVSELEKPIYIWQGLMLGNWGEMHGSRYLGKTFFLELMAILKEYLDEQTYVCVRRPSQYRMIYSTYPSGASTERRIGFFNDAILASDTDLGTYSKDASAGWGNLWPREEELEFQNQICTFAPNGGEVVFGEGYIKRYNYDELIDIFRKMRISYLNRLYDRKVIDEWQKEAYFCKGVWDGKSFYDYVAAHLGYRYHVKKADFKLYKGLDGKQYGDLNIEIENVGFSNAYDKIEVYLVSINGGTHINQHLLGTLDDIDGGSSKMFYVSLELSEYKKYETRLCLTAELARSAEDVLFANKDYAGLAELGVLQNYKIDEVKIS